MHSIAAKITILTEKEMSVKLSLSQTFFSNFSFSSQNWGKEFQVSLSLLKIGEKNMNFLFLFLIGLFGLLSMTDLLVVEVDV